VCQRLLAMTAPVALLILAAGSLHADNARANVALQQGRVDEAKSLLQTSLQQQPSDAQAHQLLCRVFYAQEMGDQAIHECQLATVQAPGDSDHQMWLARAYGLKASHTNMIAAFKLAKKVRASFAQAVQLDDSNFQAMNDLGDFYVEAPGIVGGGTDKAQVLADQMTPRFPSQAHRLRGMIAEKQSDMKTAETEFKAAVAVAHAPDTYIDLAGFYQRQHRADEAAATVRLAVATDHAKDAVLVDAATVLTDAQRSPDLAIKLLREYLASPGKSDAAPAFKVHIQLGKLLAKAGDSAGQQAEYEAAQDLASGYKVASSAPEGQ
jgi:tetratricopeptide (TPR) repeat protein